MALFMLLISCSNGTESDNGVDNITQKLMSNKWIGRNASFDVGDNDHAWVDVESITLYFTTENSGILYWIQKDYDTDLGNTITKDYSTFTYYVYGNNIRLEGLDTPFNLTLNGSYLEDGDLFFEASPMNSSDYELIKSLGPVTGKCGDNLTYQYNKKYNAIQISGCGDMYDYTAKNQPWHDLYITGVVIDEDVTSIGNNAFKGQPVTDVDWLGITKVERIGKNAFQGCMLTSIDIPNTVSTIDDEAFAECKYLTEVAFIYGSQLQNIGSHVFYNCSKLKLGRMSFGETVRKIGDNAFFSNSLGNIDFSEGVEDIGTGAFLGTIANTTLTLPNSLKTVGTTVFNGKYSKIVIGTDLEEIGKCAFISSASSGSLYINQGVPPTVEGCIIANATDWGNNEDRWTLYVPKGCKSAYSKLSPWNKFKAIYEDASLEGEGTGDDDEDNPSDDVVDSQVQDEIDAKDYRRGSVSKSFSGAGTSSSPYLISSAADLRLMSDECRNGNTFQGKYFKMTNDIVINRNVLNSNTGEPNDDSNFERWIPIGRKDRCFKGYFDGNGFCISGIYINRYVEDCVGIWGSISGVVNNLTIKDSYIKIINEVNGNAGGIIGETDYTYGNSVTQIKNCHSYAVVSGYHSGGIVGNSRYTYVAQCANYGNIMGLHSGGITSYAQRGTIIKDCINYGYIGAAQEAGGIVCWAGAASGNYGYVYNSLNAGIVSYYKEERGGGVCGLLSIGKIENCVNIENVYYQGVTKGAAILGSRRNGTFNWLKNYYLENTGNGIGNDKTEEQMKSQSFINTLNSNAKSLEEGCCSWIQGANGYPTLEWIK